MCEVSGIGLDGCHTQTSVAAAVGVTVAVAAVVAAASVEETMITPVVVVLPAIPTTVWPEL